MKFTQEQAMMMYETLEEILAYWEQFIKTDAPLIIVEEEDSANILLEGTNIQAPWSIKPPDRPRPDGWMIKGIPVNRDPKDGFRLSDIRYFQLMMAELREHAKAD